MAGSLYLRVSIFVTCGLVAVESDALVIDAALNWY